jgi:predicted nucleic acid-binding Zn ribbon protein
MYSNRPRPLGDLLKDFVENYPRRRELKRGMILSVWSEVVGSAIAKECTGLKFEGDRLIVRIKNPGWRHEVHMQRYSIMNQLNREVDEDIVKEIVVRA